MNTKLIISLTLVILLLCSVLASGVATKGDGTNFIDAPNKPVFLCFHTDWCHLCQEQEPIIDDLEQEYGGEIAFVRINGEENPQMLQEFGVESFPAMFFDYGRKRGRLRISRICRIHREKRAGTGH